MEGLFPLDGSGGLIARDDRSKNSGESDRPYSGRQEKEGIPRFGRATLLFADHDESVQRWIIRRSVQFVAKVLPVYDGEEALWVLRRIQSSEEQDGLLIVADLLLPKRDGLELCRFVRSEPSLCTVPFLMLAGGNDPEDAVISLDAGADDFLRKPFGLREYESRIGALLRRMERVSRKNAAYPFDRVEIGSLVVDTKRFEVRLHGKVVGLSYKEFQICVVLVSRYDRVVPYDDLIRLVWGEYNLTGRENLKVQVHSLKKKLLGGPSIEAVRGFGYRMRESQ